MRRFIGDGSQAVPGIPCADMSEDEWKELVKAGRITEGTPAASLWEKDKDEEPPAKAGKAGKDGE